MDLAKNRRDMSTFIPPALCIALAFLPFVHGTDYVVYPENRHDRVANLWVTHNLASLLDLNNVRPYKSDRRGVTEFWVVNVTKSQVPTISKQRGVSSK